MFSTLALLPLSWGDEYQSKCPLLDWNVSSGASPSASATGQSPQSLPLPRHSPLALVEIQCPLHHVEIPGPEPLRERTTWSVTYSGVQGKNPAIYSIWGLCDNDTLICLEGVVGKHGKETCFHNRHLSSLFEDETVSSVSWFTWEHRHISA